MSSLGDSMWLCRLWDRRDSTPLPSFPWDHSKVRLGRLGRELPRLRARGWSDAVAASCLRLAVHHTRTDITPALWSLLWLFLQVLISRRQ